VKTLWIFLLITVAPVLSFASELHWIREGGEFFLQSEGGRAAFSIQLEEEAWKKLSLEVQEKFRQSGEIYQFSHPASRWEGGKGFSSACRLIEGETPQVLDMMGLHKWLLEKKVLVYTGAGISAAAGIPTMHQLNLLFPFSLYWIESTVNSPEKVMRSIEYFNATCQRTRPTRAHWALKRFLDKTPLPLYTENFDKLHQKTGLNPACLASEGWEKETLKGYDGILCIGLSADQRGFLAQFKEMNPEGKILSIDLKQPSYLGKEDLLLQGDIQKVLPALVGGLRETNE